MKKTTRPLDSLVYCSACVGVGSTFGEYHRLGGSSRPTTCAKCDGSGVFAARDAKTTALLNSTLSGKRLSVALHALGAPLNVIRDPHGYCYFLDDDGHQVSDSVAIFAANHQSVARWLSDAKFALLSDPKHYGTSRSF